MVQEMVTTLSARDVIRRAKRFFLEQAPQYGAWLEHEGSGFVTFRGQGGEEIALAVIDGEHERRVRASSPLYGQAIARFLSTLPAVRPAA